MKAIRFHATGGPEVLRLEDAPDPVPRAGEVLIRVRAAGVNFADTRFRLGTYFVRPRFPAIPGLEAAGEIVALGEGVEERQVGERVMALGANAYAELMVSPAASTYPLPDGLSFEAAAALPVQGLTAHHLLGLAGRLRAGESVLVHAAAGGVGSLAVQLAKRAGAGLVVGTSSGAKVELVRSLGGDLAIDYGREDFAARVKEATGGRGVDVILEMLGGREACRRNLASLAPFGRLIVYGAASGELGAAIEPVSLMAKNQSVIGYYLTPIVADRALCAPALAELASLVTSGALRLVQGGSYPLADAARAHAALESRATVGKLVLLP